MKNIYKVNAFRVRNSKSSCIFSDNFSIYSFGRTLLFSYRIHRFMQYITYSKNEKGRYVVYCLTQWTKGKILQ